MDLESFRGLERLLVIGAGALSIVLGFLLFRHMPPAARGEAGGEGKVELPGGVSIYVSRVGPGVFFALFGAVVVALSFQAPLVLVEGPPPAAGPAGAAQAAQVRQLSYLDGTADSGAGALETARLRVREHVGFLNGLAADLAPDLPAERRAEIARRLRNARLDMVQAVWGDWGDQDARAAFVDWVRLGAEGDPPPGLDAPAALFRTGASP